MQHEKSVPADATRRQFLKTGVGGLVTGALLTGAALRPAANAESAATTTTAASAPTATSASANVPTSATLADNIPPPPAGSVAAPPWPYKKLDVALVRRRAYEAYFKYSCGYAVSRALIQTLQETAGGPWLGVHPEMFRYAKGGGLDWGTMCGALNASLAVLNLASAKYDVLGNELVGWYTQFPFPSKDHEAYAQIKNQVTTVSRSPLCHLSVGTWVAKVGGVRVHDKAKKNRCAKLAGDTAGKVAELLNAALENKTVLEYKPAKEFSNCLSCHQGEKSLRDNQEGKFNCMPCHTDHEHKTQNPVS